MAQDFDDALIRHVLLLQRSARGLFDKLGVTIQRRNQRIVNRARRYSDRGRPLTQRERSSILKFIDDVDRAWAAEYGTVLSGHLTQLSKIETEWTRDALNTYLGTTNAKKIRGSSRLVRDALRKTYADPRQNQTVAETIRASVGSLNRRTKNVLNRGWQEGQTIAQIGSAIRQETGATRREAEMVARTSTNSISNEARDETYRANSDIIDHLVWVSVLDEKTTDYCQFMDGQKLPLDSGPRPPAHPNCRSTTVPVLKGETDAALQGRASVGSDSARNKASLEEARVRGGRAAGRTKTYVDYEGFLRRQDAAFQDSVLGKRRGQAFRRGELTYDEMVKTTKDGYFQRPLTLEELGLN